jgi:hypothetical protein
MSLWLLHLFLSSPMDDASALMPEYERYSPTGHHLYATVGHTASEH